MKRYLLYFFASLALSVGVFACGPDDTGELNNVTTSCETSDDCSGDAQCFEEVCRTASEEACQSDFNCEAWEYCGEGTCQFVSCTDDSQCVGLNICDAGSGRCEPGCRPDADMCGDGEVCNEVTFQCEPAGCQSAADCRDHEICDDSSSPSECVPDGTCDTDLHCTRYERYVEDGVDYICGEDSQCVPKPPCESDDACSEGEICEAGECRAGCRDNDGCLLGEYCNMDELICVEGCNSDADCDEGDICHDFGGGVRECRFECNNRSVCQTDGGAPNGLDGKVCKDSICQFCQADTDCIAVQFCDLEADGSPDGLGLCTDLPPECPADTYGDNHSQANAFEVTSYPFVAEDGDPDDTRPLACRQNNGEWFAISAAAGKVIDVTIEYDTSAGNLDVALVDQNGDDLVAADDPPQTDPGVQRVQYGTADAIDAYVQVRGTLVVGNTPYRIEIDVRDPETCTDDGFEPNDTDGDAVALPADTAHTDLEVCGDNKDFYLLDISDAHNAEITLTSPSNMGNVEMFLHKPDMSEIVEESTGVSDTERIYFGADQSEGGLYILEVSLPDSGNSVGKAIYDLEWTQGPNICIDPAEPNDSCADAYRVQDGTSMTDLRICGDDDYYVVSLNPLDTLRATVTYDPSVSQGDMQLSLYGRDRNNPFGDPCGILLQSASETSAGTLIEMEIDYQAQLGGDFYIQPSRFLGLNVKYDLDVEVIPGPACDDDSYDENGNNNDDATNAVALDAADVTGNGPDSALVGQKICDANQDWYSITVADGSSLTWEIVHDATEGAIGATLIDSDGTTPVTDGNGDPITLDGSGQINVTNSSGADKMYYLRVEGDGGIPVRNTYWLLTYVDGSGPSDATCPDIYENNDDGSNAVSVPAGTQASNLLICGGDSDWYKTSVEAGQTITVTADFDSPTATPGLYLFEAHDLNNDVVSGTPTANTYTASFTSARDQDIYYRVNTSSGVSGDAYSLDVNLSAAPACTDDRFDGNHDSATAEPLAAPGLYSRLMSCDDEADWYAVNLTNGELFEAYINYDDTRADLDVEIYQPDGITPANSGDTSATVTPSSDATYYVRVASADPSVSVRLGYDLLLYRDDDLSGAIDPDEGPADRTCPDAYENNDTRTGAADVPAGSYTDLLLCAGSPVDDDDFFSVYVPAGVTLTVTANFDNAEGNIDLRLFDDTNLRVDRSEQTTTDTESVTVTNTTSIGRDYVVQVLGGTGSFQSYYSMDVELAFDPNDPCIEDSYSGNTDMASASGLTAGAYDLALCESTEDWFTFDIPAGETVEANVELRNRLGNIDMELQDVNGNELAGSATNDNVETLTYTNTDASALTVYLRVYPKGGAFMRNNYDLWLAIGSNMPTTPFCPDMYERNDSTTTAYSFEFTNEPHISDAIMCSVEEDWYSVDLTSASATYHLATFFEHYADFDLALEVRDQNGNLVADPGGNDITFSSHSADNDELVSFSPPSSGTYFIGVKQMGGDAAVQGDYAMYLNSSAMSCPEDNFEDNNTPATSKLLTAGTHGLASCTGSNNAADDYWRFEPIADGTITVEVMFDDSQLELSGAFDSFSPNMTSSKNRLTYTGSVTAGTAYTMYLGNVSGSGPYFVNVTYN